jgi:lipopolysaccharide biosynthesis regulator YciM
MEPDLGWLLIGLPVAFALGWLASRLDLRQLRRARDDSPRTYYKGLNLLLNEQQDQAIDAFIEEVQGDPESTGLHFALGNLFRRRGEFGRAVRVHRHLLERADLKAEDRERAQLALAQDYMKAGLFDRAEAAWAALLGSTFDEEAQLALLSLYERSRGCSNTPTTDAAPDNPDMPLLSTNARLVGRQLGEYTIFPAGRRPRSQHTRRDAGGTGTGGPS